MDKVTSTSDNLREMDKDSIAGSKVRSTRSSKSSRSRASSAIVEARRVEAVANAAALRAKLKYLDKVQQKKAELEQKQAELDKLITIKELSEAEAQVSALEALSDESASYVTENRDLPVPDGEKKEFVQQYVQSLPNYVSPEGTVEPPMPFECQTPSVQSLKTHDDTPEPYVIAPTPMYSPLPQFPKSGPELALSDPPGSCCAETSAVPQATLTSAVPQATLTSAVPQATLTSAVPQATLASAVPQPTLTNLAPRDNGMIDLAKTLAEQVYIARLPPPEPGVFNGDPLTYPTWRAAFDVLIAKSNVASMERIYYLKRYLQGAAREAVEGYFLIPSPSEDIYHEAMNLLQNRFGNPYVVAEAFRDKLDGWPKIGSKDGLALRRFADFLRQCHAGMQGNINLNVLDDVQENGKMLTKLPDWMTRRWVRFVSDYKEKARCFPPFSEFMKFVVKEAEIACEPITTMKTIKPKEVKDHKRTPGASCLSIDSKETTSNHKETNSKKCALCEKSHHLVNCKLFKNKDIESRKTLIREKRLCYGCLNPGHVSKNCNHRLKCEVCTKRHPTCLHGDIRSDNSTKDGNSTVQASIPRTSVSHRHLSDTDTSPSMASMIVPVWLSHRDAPEKETLLYALLDSQSDTTFILEDACNALEVDGCDVMLSLSTMSASNQMINSQKIAGLQVRGYNTPLKLTLPEVYTREIMPANRSHIPTPEMAMRWPHLNRVADQIPPLMNCNVGLLIGYNCSTALVPREIIPPEVEGQPYAQRTDLGWGIVGIINPSEIDNPHDHIGVSHRVVTTCTEGYAQVTSPVTIKEVINPYEVNRFMEMDFSERKFDYKVLSQDDKQFINILQEGIHQRDDLHYEMPLPFKGGQPANLPNNKVQALQRLKQTKNRLMRDPQYRNHYVEFMQNIIDCGFAEQVPVTELNNQPAWYIPHHGVYHPQKQDKIRIVFDCSAQYSGKSLNDHLLSGPDMTNTLVGVMCRFRREPVAFICDIQQMFFQFWVNKEHRDYLRFLWWQDGNYETEPKEFRMNVHLFGASSSPSCANFGLKQIANDYEVKCGARAADFLRHGFYVDDGCTSVSTTEEAINLIKATKDMCTQGGLHLHKFVSNSRIVMTSVPPEDRAKGIKDVDLLTDIMPVERALGVQWCIESDTFQFRITLKDQPLTRRGILSTICSIYDPFGFLAPVLLVGKKILQQMCREGLDWDSPLSETLRSQWELWRNNLPQLENLKIRRCYKPDNFGDTKIAQLHHFSDASTEGYGQCSYLRLVNESNQVHCTLLMGKSRVTPLKAMTIPRLELTAAVVSVKVSTFLMRELQLKEDVEEYFWTDSKVVLGYISNDSRRFHVFVANRVSQIRDHSEPTQWGYVNTKENPADEASRGITPQDLCSSSKWLTGPDFLWTTDFPRKIAVESELSPEDPEVKKSSVLTTNAKKYPDKLEPERIDYFSSWMKAKRAVANCLRYKALLKYRVMQKKDQSTQAAAPRSLTVSDIAQAEHEIVKGVQAETFQDELKILSSLQMHQHISDRETAKKRNQAMKATSSLFRLDPFLDKNGIMRVGGRVRRANFSDEIKHPIIMPRKHHVTELLIRHFHEKSGHQGRGMTTNEIRSNGYWIVGCSSAVSSYISKCVKCRKLRSQPQDQKMADLPVDRLQPAPPFTYCGVDYFGPWYIREGRSDRKKYGVLFTCLASRAIHLETANSLSTDSFLNALRRFLALRGPIRLLRSDRGTNFVGAEAELKSAYEQLDQKRVHEFLLEKNCDYFEWKMNVPNASHMGGVWERQIRTVRSVLSSLMNESGSQLNDEALRTFMYEAAAIVNSRPLTVENLNDPKSCEPLTPNHLLSMKTKILLPPPGEFQRSDLYCRKQWRRVQHLLNQFWTRWKKEFLQALQTRPKWIQSKRDFKRGDIVIVKEENSPRNSWRLARVDQTYEDADGHVRKVKLVASSQDVDAKGRRSSPLVHLERPIHKLVLLLEEQE